MTTKKLPAFFIASPFMTVSSTDGSVASAWSGYDFFYGITYTDWGWAITEFHDYGNDGELLIPVETRPDLWAACERAEMENIAMGMVPSYGWRSSNEI